MTGAAGGIGRATTERLVAEGASVVATDLTDASLEWTSGAGSIAAVAADITDEDTNVALVSTAVERFGGLNAMVLNAGIVGQQTIEREMMDAFDRMIEVNVRAVALGMRAGLPSLRESGDGAIVVTGSVSGLFGDPTLWSYNASKAAVVNMARSVSLDVAHTGVRVNSICPGPIRTNMTGSVEGTDMGDAMKARVPLQRFGEPHEVAAAISFLASPDASFITGVALPVDGGITCGTGQWNTYAGRKKGFW